MHALILAGLAMAFTIVGGGIPLTRRAIDGKVLAWLVAFAAGILLSVGLYEMLADALAILGRTALLAAATGFLLLYLLERVTIIHTCHDDEHQHHLGVFSALGICFHSVIDGLSLAVSQEFGAVVSGLVALGILLHRLPTGVSMGSILVYSRVPRPRAWAYLIANGAMAVVGALIGLSLRSGGHALLGGALGFSAGNFLYLATGDLLPEAHRDHRDAVAPACFVGGFLLNFVSLTVMEGIKW